MKTLERVLFGLFIFTFYTSIAQVSVNVNFGTPPVWAPSNRVETQYYYLPEINTYYDVPSEQFIYINRGIWVRSKVLPVRYNHYNLRTGRVIFLTDYRGNSPYKFHKNHSMKYQKKYLVNNNVVMEKRKYRSGKNHGKGNGKGRDKKN